MPIYEYQCEKCGEFEVTQRITEPALKKCPTCKSKVKKLISATTFQLKGSGWYVTDYGKSGSGGRSSKSESSSESKGDSKSESKSDTKSESKSTTSSDSKASKATDKAAA